MDKQTTAQLKYISSLQEKIANLEKEREMDWISVDDRLPEEGVLVLVKDEEGRKITGEYEIKHDGPCWRLGNSTFMWDYDYDLDYEVTHWTEIIGEKG